MQMDTASDCSTLIERASKIHTQVGCAGQIPTQMGRLEWFAFAAHLGVKLACATFRNFLTLTS